MSIKILVIGVLETKLAIKFGIYTIVTVYAFNKCRYKVIYKLVCISAFDNKIWFNIHII